MASNIHVLLSNSYHVIIVMASSTHDLSGNSYHVTIAMANSTHDLTSNSYHISIVYKSDMQTFAKFCHYNSSITIATVGYYWWFHYIAT